MINIRDAGSEDVDNLIKAIEADSDWHGGKADVEFFTSKPGRPVVTSVIEDEKGPITFIRVTKSLRVCCAWCDEKDSQRNARAVIFGITEIVKKARESGFTEVIIHTDGERLGRFLNRVMKMEKRENEFVLDLTQGQ
jgi:hypothetical protein